MGERIMMKSLTTRHGCRWRKQFFFLHFNPVPFFTIMKCNWARATTAYFSYLCLSGFYSPISSRKTCWISLLFPFFSLSARDNDDDRRFCLLILPRLVLLYFALSRIDNLCNIFQFICQEVVMQSRLASYPRDLPREPSVTRIHTVVW